MQYPLKSVERFSRAGPRGRGREWATLGVHPLSWILSNNRLEEVCGTLTTGTFSSRLLLSNQDKGCTPSVAHSLPLPLGPALLNLWNVNLQMDRCMVKVFNSHMEFFHMMTSAKSGGGETSELLCNEPPCNYVFIGMITIQIGLWCESMHERNYVWQYPSPCHVYPPRFVAFVLPPPLVTYSPFDTMLKNSLQVCKTVLSNIRTFTGTL